MPLRKSPKSRRMKMFQLLRKCVLATVVCLVFQLAGTLQLLGNDGLATAQATKQTRSDKPGEKKVAQKPPVNKNKKKAGSAFPKDGEKESEIPDPIVRLPKTKVSLADGVEVEVDEFGDTFMGYQYKLPIRASDHRHVDGRDFSKGFLKADPGIETVIDYFAVPGLRGRVTSVVLAMVIDPDKKWIYWMDGTSRLEGAIYRTRLDGSQISQLVHDIKNPSNLAFDRATDRLFFGGKGKAQSVKVDGTSLKDVMTGLQHATGMTIDPDKKYIYAIDQTSGPNLFFRSTIDGEDKTLISRDIKSRCLAWDAVDRKLYWGGVPFTSLRCSNIDGSDQRDVFTGETFVQNGEHDPTVGETWSFQINKKTRELYFRVDPRGSIRRVPLGGGTIEEVLCDTTIYGAIAVDSVNDYLYFCDQANDVARIRRIRIPKHPVAKEFPSPPAIVAMEPINVAIGQRVQISGKGFTSRKITSQLFLITAKRFTVTHATLRL